MKLSRIGILPNLAKPEIKEVLEKIVSMIPGDIEVVVLRETMQFSPDGRFTQADGFDGCDAVIALGGDGTLLAAARLVETEQIPVLGIKLKSLGFLTEDDPARAVDELLRGEYTIQERMRIKASVVRGGKKIESFTALNDVVVHATGVSRVLQLRTRIKDFVFGEYLADGVIVSTPTGSTAYSLAAGGPIVNPTTTDCIIITPLCPHSLSVRPLVINSREALSVEVVEDGERSLITIDGQKGCPVMASDVIEFKRSELVTRLIVNRDYNFYELVRDKLRWGGVLRRR